MHIEVGRSNVVNGMIEITVHYHEVLDDLGHAIQVNVWVPDVDSRSEIREAALAKAKMILGHALSAHPVEDP